MSTKSKVAVIGLGSIGTVVATNLVKGNRPVILASRKLEDAESLAQKLGNLATASELSAAIKEANMIIMSVWFSSIKELLSKYSAEFKGKIIIDPSNPIGPDEKGGFKKIIGEKESAGQLISHVVPEGAKLVKAFGSLSVASLSSAAFQEPNAAVLFYATDETSINADIEQLIRDSGFEPLCIGGLDQSIRMEVFGDLHEYGALGKTVTITEAKTKV